MTERTETTVSETVPIPDEIPEVEERFENRDGNQDTTQPKSVKINDFVRYKLNDEWVTGTITGRAGKATGKYKTWYNIRGENNEERSIDLGSLEWERIPETEINLTYTDSRTSEDKDIITAKEK